jgi:hypothetical protein
MRELTTFIRILGRILLAEAGLVILALASPLSGEALNEQGNAITRGTKPASLTEWITVATDDGGKSPTETTTGKKLKLTQSYATGNIVVITKLNAKTGLGETEGGLIVGVPYYARAISGTEIAFANSKAQSESATESEWIEFTVTIKAETVVKKIEEHTGAKTKRIKTAFAAAVNLINEDATAREVEASATVKVRWLLYFSAETSGTFMGLEATTEKELATADLLKVTNQKIPQNAYLI